MVKDFNANVGFSDEEDFESSEGVSIKTIVLRHISKISELMCKELTGAYWSRKPIKTPSGILFTEVYHEDLREAYCNAVNFLIDILEPLGDKDFKKYIKDNEDIDNEEKDIIKKVIKKRKTFREINIMFDRKGFFESAGVANETYAPPEMEG